MQHQEMVTTPDQLTPAYLTHLFRAWFPGSSAAVEAVMVLPHTDYHSTTFRLQLSWSQKAAEHPDALFLKLLGEHRGRREIAIYRHFLDEQVGPPFLAPCYDAAYDPETGRSHLLLADLSASHSQLASRDEIRGFVAQPSGDLFRAALGALAGWHAHWWESPLLHGSAIPPFGPYASEAAYQDYVQQVERAWERFYERVPWLPQELATLYTHLIAHMPRLWHTHFQKRLMGGQQLTLAHGDCSLSQFLAPRNLEAGQTFLIDFDSVRPDLPASDLVLLLATFWMPEQRRIYEQQALRDYHAALSSTSVVPYSWDDFLDDYRLGIAWQAIYPIWGMLQDEPQDFWWARMQCITAAYQEWWCGEWLGERTRN